MWSSRSHSPLTLPRSRKNKNGFFSLLGLGIGTGTMGSGSSKEAAGPSSSSSRGGGWRLRSRWAFSSSCFGPPSTLGDHQTEEENGSLQSNSRTDEAACKVNQGNHESSRMFGVPQVSKFSSWTSSDTANHGESQEGTSRTGTGASSRTPNMQSTVGQSSSHPSHSHPRFGLISDAIGLRLNRAVSLGSSGAHSFFSGSASVSNSDGVDHVHVGRDSSMNNTNETQENVTMDAVSSHGMVGNNANFGAASSECSRRNCSEIENFARRHPSRLRHQELLEGSIRFSRTLSVGRLRDRVLRRASYTDGLLGSMLLEDQFTGYTGQGNGRRALSHISRTSSSNRVVELTDSPRNSISQIISSMDSSRDYDPESSQYREYTNRDLLVHRSAFLERRRRIRSQVRALQQLGSRFENLSRHDRSCILSGQHRTGRCTCRTNSRTTIPDEDTNTRGSISRIVMLAEALFEVLDEIHQQSVVLSSQPSFSSIGSVPAPKEVVECMPVKVYVKPQRHQNEEALQCYICLVEYEEGDLIRMLPCHHEFHQICIDKWLKEIHRVCPLCRGDVCISESASVEKV